MAISFILISAAPAKEHDVYNKLSKVPEIIGFSNKRLLIFSQFFGLDRIMDGV